MNDSIRRIGGGFSIGGVQWLRLVVGYGIVVEMSWRIVFG